MSDQKPGGKPKFAERRRRMADRTLDGDPQGWFIPYRYASETLAREPDYPIVRDLFQQSEPEFLDHLHRIADFQPDLQKIGVDDEPPVPRWNQNWFPGLDAAAAYAMVRHHEPDRIIEVGSGHSTRFLARAVSDGGLATDIVAIDPAPRADLAGLGITFHRQIVQDVSSDTFATLKAGDVLSVDSSHILMQGTDVDVLFANVLPVLPGGVIVHIHDITLPDPYPLHWQGREYNEQSGVAILLGSGVWRPLFSSHWARHQMADAYRECAGFIPRPSEFLETSLWLQKS